MTSTEILSNLCAYDARNPLKIAGTKKHHGPCYCDNCFYGRTRMAEYILELRKAIQGLVIEDRGKHFVMWRDDYDVTSIIKPSLT